MGKAKEDNAGIYNKQTIQGQREMKKNRKKKVMFQCIQ